MLQLFLAFYKNKNKLHPTSVIFHCRNSGTEEIRSF
jgi:hypothetical protein